MIEPEPLWIQCVDIAPYPFVPVLKYADDTEVLDITDIEYLSEHNLKDLNRSLKLGRINEFERSLETPVLDCTQLKSLTCASVMHNITTQLFNRRFYINAAHVLIALNPNQETSLFSLENQKAYINSHKLLPPHPYNIAAKAVHNLVHHPKQTIVVSGDSGSGKTETAKFILEFLSNYSVLKSTSHKTCNTSNKDISDKSSSSDNSDGSAAYCSAKRTAKAVASAEAIHQSAIATKVLHSNCILEAFANAQTIRNNNSSRFGKHTRLYFTNNMILTACEIDVYLLEIARVMTHEKGERNFHIFYQLLAGLSNTELAALHLVRDPAKYKILCPCDSVVSEADKNSFFFLRAALLGCKFTPTHCAHIFRTLAGLLILGNTDFGDLTALPETPIPLELTVSASLLGLQPNALFKYFRTFKVANEEVSRSSSQAATQLPGFIKHCYGELFKYIVNHLNEQFQGDTNAPYSISILDLYGFEVLGRNGLDQLFINFANETMHYRYLRDMFEADLRLFATEGITVPDPEVPNNSEAIKSIQNLLRCLDDATRRRDGNPVQLLHIAAKDISGIITDHSSNQPRKLNI